MRPGDLQPRPFGGTGSVFIVDDAQPAQLLFAGRNSCALSALLTAV